ncbi:CueP family metal-binding protein [Ornithinimicrobium sp. W1679]|uniref:CueP family metal-binding protein n=1 Tax=Ornithinimicrobium sp. W1679 TaxID=3418770 RepID=UPI003CEBF070
MPTFRPLLPLGLAAVLTLAGCSTGDPEPAPTASTTRTGDQASVDAMLAKMDLAGTDARTIVEELDTSVDARPLPLAASVREDALLLGDGQTEVALPLPEDEFYVSLAPFHDQTHECYFHSLATCQGELAQEEVTVRIVTDDGTVLVDETTTTYSNGFVGFWVPRDVAGTIEVEHEGATGSVPFATTEGSPTCITTLQLEA